MEVAVILWSALQSRQSYFKPYTPIAAAVDFLLNVGAILLATTLYADTPLLLNLLLLAPVAIIYALPRHHSSKKAKVPPKVSKDEIPNPLPKKSFLTTYRGAMLVVTCTSILAVDFRIFPRRFAKVENWGTSLMDIGVGSFVFSAGVVAARPILKDQLTNKSTPLGTRLFQSTRHSIPLLILGFIRLWTVKGLDYAEHVTEYGVHWNFFFTLGFMPPFLALFRSANQFLPYLSYPPVLATLVAGTYQLVLEFTDLKAYILTAPRTNLISQNREGIFSFFGYLAIFLSGQATGMYVIPRTTIPQTQTQWAVINRLRSSPRRWLLTQLICWSTIWTLLFTISTSYNYGAGIPISRRLANMPYFLWITAFNCWQITAFCVVETVFFPQAYKSGDTSRRSEEEAYRDCTSRVLHAFNRNGLAIFLVANLLTGLVNLTVPTLDVGSVLAMGVLLGYAGVLTGLALGLDGWDVSIKM